MKRRDFSRLSAALVVAAPVGAVFPARAQERFQEGVDFLALDQRAATEAPAGKIEVVEFFWYNCPHCNAFEPRLAQWLQQLPQDVHFRRIPVAFQDSFVPQQRLYFTLDALGEVERLHAKVFAAIHQQRRNLTRADAIADWAVEQGLDRKRFVEVFNSFAVSTRVTRATQFQDIYQVQGVPSLGVAGRFYTDATIAKNMDRALRVVEALVSGIRSGR